MRPFAAVERFFERIFERPGVRLFHPRLQPIQLQRRVERAMETGRLSSADRMVVPNRYVVRLAPADVSAFGDLGPSLEVELADAALRFARNHRFTVSDRPAIRIVADEGVGIGDVRVDASFSDPPPPEPVAIPVADEPPGIRAAGARPRPAPPPIAEPTQTMVFQVPAADTPLAILREISPDGRQRQHTMEGGPVTIGRADDNDLVLNDLRISRHHGRLTARRGALVYTDLGSTNGSRVNGIEVDEVVLGAGDRIEVGDTILVVQSAPGS